MAGTPGDGWHLVAKRSEIEADEPKQVQVGEMFIGLYEVGGQIYAINDVCTHEFAFLTEGYVDGDIVECPFHQACFHIPTGEAKSPPADKAVATYAVKEEGDDVYIQIR